MRIKSEFESVLIGRTELIVRVAGLGIVAVVMRPEFRFLLGEGVENGLFLCRSAGHTVRGPLRGMSAGGLRTAAAGYDLTQSVALDKLENLADQQDLALLDNTLLPALNALPEWPLIALNSEQSRQLYFGSAVTSTCDTVTRLTRGSASSC